jgi:hypothetical protein
MKRDDRQNAEPTGLSPVGLGLWLGGGAVVWVLLSLLGRVL